MIKPNRLSKIIGLTSLGAMLPSTLLAAVEEVIVTAQKQEENMQSVPVAVSALSSSQLTEKGVTSFEGIARSSPSITFTPFPSSTTTLVLYIRAQGIADPGQIASDGSVGLYQDGFYIARPQASTFDLADIERVEILRGPQGTLYGRNTIGGAVNLISKTPTGEFGLRQDLSVGSLDYFRSLTTINLPKAADLSTKFTLLHSSRDGYVRNTGASRDYGEEYQRAGRFSMRWDPMEKFYVDYSLEKGDLDSTPLYFQNPSLNGMIFKTANGPLYGGAPYFSREHSRMSSTWRPVDLNLSTSNFEGHGLTMTRDINDNLSLKSLTGFRRLYYHAYQDYAEAFGTPFASVDQYAQHQFSQEFQFIGNALDSRINYILGLYYFEEAGSHRNRQNYAAKPNIDNRKVNADGASRAIFGQLSWTPPFFDDRLDITVGARFTRDNKNASRNLNSVNRQTGDITMVEDGTAATGAVNRQRFSRFNPALTLNFKWSDDISTYAKVATGYKAGGSSESLPPGQFNHTYGPEELTNYEAGLKSYWLDRSLRANLTAFYSKLKDKQIGISTNPAKLSEVQVFNAGRLYVKGFEAELLYAPIEDFSLSLDYAYLQGEFTQVKVPADTILDHNTNPLSPYNAGDNIKELFVLPFAPKHSVSTSADYTFLRFNTGNLSAHLDYRWQDSNYINSSAGPAVAGRDFQLIPAYGILNGRLTLALDLPKGDKAKLSFWGKNITHKRYFQYVAGTPGTLVATPNPAGGVIPAGNTAHWLAWEMVPTYGFDLSYEY